MNRCHYYKFASHTSSHIASSSEDAPWVKAITSPSKQAENDGTRGRSSACSEQRMRCAMHSSVQDFCSHLQAPPPKEKMEHHGPLSQHGKKMPNSNQKIGFHLFYRNSCIRHAPKTIKILAILEIHIQATIAASRNGHMTKNQKTNPRRRTFGVTTFFGFLVFLYFCFFVFCFKESQEYTVFFVFQWGRLSPACVVLA